MLNFLWVLTQEGFVSPPNFWTFAIMCIPILTYLIKEHKDKQRDDVRVEEAQEVKKDLTAQNEKVSKAATDVKEALNGERSADKARIKELEAQVVALALKVPAPSQPLVVIKDGKTE